MVQIVDNYMTEREDYLIIQMRIMYGEETPVTKETLGCFESYFGYLEEKRAMPLPKLKLVELSDRL